MASAKIVVEQVNPNLVTEVFEYKLIVGNAPGAKGAAGTTDISALTAKVTPVDADLALIADSAASFLGKKITFANLWVWIKTKIATVAVTLKIYSETNNTVTAGATETIPATHRNHSYTLTEACVFTAPTLPAAGVRDSHVVDIGSETFATSWAATPAIRWTTSDNLAPTLDTTAGTVSTITLRSNAAGTFWQGRDGGETVAP